MLTLVFCEPMPVEPVLAATFCNQQESPAVQASCLQVQLMHVPAMTTKPATGQISLVIFLLKSSHLSDGRHFKLCTGKNLLDVKAPCLRLALMAKIHSILLQAGPSQAQAQGPSTTWAQASIEQKLTAEPGSAAPEAACA